MANTKTPQMPKKKSAASSANVVLDEIHTFKEIVQDDFDRLRKRVDQLQGSMDDLAGLSAELVPEKESEQGKPCSCRRMAMVNMAEGLLWGMVIGSMLTALLFAGSISRHRRNYYFRE